jgi:hypothetical protein
MTDYQTIKQVLESEINARGTGAEWAEAVRRIRAAIPDWPVTLLLVLEENERLRGERK